MGIRDYLAPGNVCLVEWPERGEGILPVPDLELTLTPARDGRSLVLQARSDIGRVLLSHLTEHTDFAASAGRQQTETDQD